MKMYLIGIKTLVKLVNWELAHCKVSVRLQNGDQIKSYAIFDDGSERTILLHTTIQQL